MVDELAMSSENNKLKALEEALAKMGGQNAELKEQNGKLNVEIAELKRQIAALNATKLIQEIASKSTDSISTLMPKKRSNEECNDLAEQMDAKRPKLLANYIPNWLIEVLAWIKRMEMADSFLPTSCRTFNQLCWSKLHGKNVKPHRARHLTFSHHLDKWGNIHANIAHSNSKYVGYDECDNPHCAYPFDFPIPIPCVPPPDYIQTCNSITFEFLNGELVEFIKGLVPLMENVNIVVDMEMDKWNAGDNCVTMLKRLFDMLRDKILKITFEYPIGNFCRLFPDFLFPAEKLHIEMFIQNDKEIDFLVDWLYATSLRNGHAKQKYLRISYYDLKKEFERDFVDRLIEQFTNASQAQNYFVSYPSKNQNPDEFTLENKQTGEMLALRHKICPIIGLKGKFLVRCPKGEGNAGRKKYQNQGWPSEIYLKIKKFAI